MLVLMCGKVRTWPHCLVVHRLCTVCWTRFAAWLCRPSSSCKRCHSPALHSRYSHAFCGVTATHPNKEYYMKILFINNDGGGFADYIDVAPGMSVQQLFAD